MNRFRVQTIAIKTAGQLTCNWPGMRWPVDSLEDQLVWWPHGLPAECSSRVAFVSSHLGKFPEQYQEWLNTISQTIQRLPRSTIVVCTTRNLLGELVLEACRIHQHPVVLVDDSPQSANEQTNEDLSLIYPMQLSMPVPTDLPSADVEIVALADSLVVGPIRKRGKVAQVLERYGDGKRRHHAAVSGQSPQRATQTLESVNETVSQTKDRTSLPAELIHWTRACAGPWPKQSRREWLRSLINNQGDHSAFATLCRIARMRVILPSANGISGDVACVCLTETSLKEFTARRVYRNHRCRWDFERYGLILPMSVLDKLQPSKAVYIQGSASPRSRAMLEPYLQPTGSHIDWTQENEWRVAGAVPLPARYDDSIRVFVATLEEAKLLRSIVPWQATVLG